MPLFKAVKKAIDEAVPAAGVRIQKSQIAFHGSRNFAYVWLPIRPNIKGRPEVYIVVSFGLDHKIDNPKIVDPVQPYPNRWTHHLIIGSVADIDRQFSKWIRAAYELSERK